MHYLDRSIQNCEGTTPRSLFFDTAEGTITSGNAKLCRWRGRRNYSGRGGSLLWSGQAGGVIRLNVGAAVTVTRVLCNACTESPIIMLPTVDDTRCIQRVLLTLLVIKRSHKVNYRTCVALSTFCEKMCNCFLFIARLVKASLVFTYPMEICI